MGNKASQNFKGLGGKLGFGGKSANIGGDGVCRHVTRRFGPATQVQLASNYDTQCCVLRSFSAAFFF